MEVPPELVAVTETVYEPGSVGEPVMAPVVVLMVTPVGNPVADHDVAGLVVEVVVG